MPAVRIPIGALLLALGGFPVLAVLSPHRQPCTIPSWTRWITFDTRDLEGRAWTAEALEGQPVVLVFWATWTRGGSPAPDPVAEAARRNPDAAFFGVLYADEADRAVEHLRGVPPPFPTLLDPDGRLALEAGVGGVPEVVVADRSGAVVARLVPPFDPVEIEVALDQARTGRGPVGCGMSFSCP